MRGDSNTGRGKWESWTPTINNNWKLIGEKKIITLFVDNLPDDSRSIWVYNLFAKFGRVRDLFIPRKTSKISGKRFGFVRFARREEAIMAIEKTNGLWIWGNNLTVKIARFEANRGDSKEFVNVSVKKKGNNQQPKQQGAHFLENKRWSREEGREKKNEAKKVWRKKEGSNVKLIQEKSYLDALKGNSWIKPKQPIHLKELGNEWLYRSAIAKLSPVRSMALVQDHLRSLGYADIQVRIMGGDSVVLTFLNSEVRDSMFNGGKMAWLKDWFIESYKWEESTIKPLSCRLIWLNCYGIPTQLWNVHNFMKIGQYWGEVIQVSEDTIKDLSFAVGKVLVSTSIMEGINEVIQVECKGCRYKIRVTEEQLVVNTFLKTECSCQGCNCKSSQEESGGIEYKSSKYAGRIEKAEPNGAHKIMDLVEDSIGLVNSVQEVEVVQDSCDSSEKLSRVEDSVDALGKTHGMDNTINEFLEPPSNNCRELVVAKSRSFNSLGLINSAKGTGRVTKEYFQPKIIMCPQLEASLRDNRSQIQRALSNYSRTNESSWSVDAYNREFLESKVVTTRTVKEKAVASTKRKHKSIEEILGIPKAGNSKKGGKKNKQKKAVVFRGAIAEAALSVSSGGINNRNRILLNEAEAVWAVSKILGEDYSGDDEEVISRIMLMEEQEEDRAAQLNNDLLIA